MAVWDVRPGGARGVVSGVERVVSGFAGDVRSYDDALAALGVALVESDTVEAALSEFVDQCAVPDIRLVDGHCASAIAGTRLAIQAYVSGDATMRDTAQRNAAAAVYPRSMPGNASGSLSSTFGNR